MTRAELVGLLDRLFGSQKEAACQMKTPYRTIIAWGNENPVPKPVAALLRMLDAERKRKD